MAKGTTMLEQYQIIKQKHRKHLLFFRVGDFYELFFEDAEIAARELQLTLTRHAFMKDQKAPMCGVPHHSVDIYIKKLVNNGHKVAVCEQLEDPAAAKGLVSREVVRVVTPGTITDGSMLDAGKNNYICAVFIKENLFGIAFADVSTGTVYIMQSEDSRVEAKVIDQLDRFTPSEILFNESFIDYPKITAYLKNQLKCTAELLDDSLFDEKQEPQIEALRKQFAGSVELSKAFRFPFALKALCGLISYLKETQKQGVHRLIDLKLYEDQQYMDLDIAARRNLELTQTFRTAERRGSLLGVLDETKTSMGKRLIRQWIEQPLLNPSAILKRQDAVAELIEKPEPFSDLLQFLSKVYDLERLMTRVIYKMVTPRELKTLSYTAQYIPKIKQIIHDFSSSLFKELYERIADLEDVYQLIERAIADDPPISFKDGNIIRKGFNPKLDELRNIRDNSKDFLVQLESREKEKTGIKKLKVAYNRVFGYYIEVSNSYISMVPSDYERKQTLTNCERYITKELKDYEHEILSSTERANALENEIFTEIRDYVSQRLHYIQETAGALAALDVLCSFAAVSVKRNYVRPTMLADGKIKISDGRHPVVETTLDMPFVPNDTLLNSKNELISIITGPNMAGKSTYMRQVALIVLMAQIGCFVPAQNAEISIVDKIFTRIGASDDLAAGKSTFMVEMSEVSYILQNATPNSLIILDEVGRGTSTFDGMSIAQSVIEYIIANKKIHAKTLFATHYHELTAMANDYACITNYSIAVKRRGEEIIFLRKIIKGAADDSYGIDVARLAGLPPQMIKRANEILFQLESQEKSSPKPLQEGEVLKEDMMQITFEKNTDMEVIEKLQDLSVDTLSPLEALNILFELKKMVKSRG